MQEIRAIIRPSKLEKLRDALRAMPDFPGFSVMKVEGFTAPSLIQKRSIAEELVEYSPKLMIFIVATEDMTQAIVRIIVDSCSTSQIGDGLVWTTTLSGATRIKNGLALAA
jgi:nitrogen regulatory protein P-II 1